MILVMLAFALATDKPAKVYKVVSVDGVGYKVTQRGENVSIAQRGAAFHVPTGKTKQAAMIAAEFATGCTVTDSFLYRVVFKATVDCSKTPEKPTGVEVRDITAET